MQRPFGAAGQWKAYSAGAHGDPPKIFVLALQLNQLKSPWKTNYGPSIEAGLTQVLEDSGHVARAISSSLEAK